MPLINQVIAQYLNPDELKEIGQQLDIWVQDSSPDTMARMLVEGARRKMRLDTLFNLVKEYRSDLDLAPNLHELVANTFRREEMLDLCRRLGLDSKGLGLDENGLIGWDHDRYLQRKKAELAQEQSGTAAFLQAVAQVKPDLDLTAFGQTAEPPPAASPTPANNQSLPPKPPKVSFENFDITVSKFGDSYAIQASYSQGGEDRVNSSNLNLIAEQDVQDLLVSLDNLSGDIDLAETVGELMRERLFPSEIWTLFTTARGNAKDRHDSGLRVRLRISPPEIGMLPWEYCFDQNYDFLALRRELPLVRYIEQPFIPDDVEAPRPTKVLLVSASPKDPSLMQIDADAEAEQIYQELQPLVNDGELAVKHIKSVTWDVFQSEVVSYRPHILHFIGHGTFDIDRERGALLLEREDGTPHSIRPRSLANLFRGTEVKVLILNACKTAAFGQNNAFMGLAPALVRAEVPAVIAMQFAMPDDTAARFARQIYHFLAMGLPLDRAITEARINIFAYDDTFWAVPVLFMRSQDGVIWQERES
jgi:hypothetical protein